MKKITRRSFLKVAGATSAVAALAACAEDASSTASSAAVDTNASSQGAADANTEKSEEQLTVIIEVSPTVLTNLNYASVLQVFPEAITSSLFQYNHDEMSVAFCLAESYDAIDDTHYRFKLREDAVYADGTPVTAKDVVYSFTNYKATGMSDMQCMDVENFVIEDDHTFILALTEYILGWEFCLCSGSSAIYNEDLIEQAGGIDSPDFLPVGCGRYNVKEWRTGEYLLVERNDNYWNEKYVAYYKTIKYQFVSDSSSRTLAVRSGDADIANRIGVADYMGLQNDSVAYGYAYPAGVVNSVYYNCETGVCSDVKVREALSYAIDPEAVNQVINLGLAEVEQGIFPSNFRFYEDMYGGPLYDPEKAKELLKEAGYETGLSVHCIVFDTFKDAATVVQESLRQVGVTLEVDSMDNATWTPLVRAGEYDITIGNSAIACVNATMLYHIDPDKMGISAYNIRMDTPEIREAISTLNSPDEAQQEQGFSDLFEIIFGQYAVCGLCGGDKYMAMRKGITGLRIGTTNGFADVSCCYPE